MGREYFRLVCISARWSRSHSVEMERLQIVCLNSSTQRGMQLIRLSVGVSDERVVNNCDQHGDFNKSASFILSWFPCGILY